jgi:hypothetical protein
MNRRETIVYKGQEIVCFDYKGLRGAELLEQIKANTQFVLNSPKFDLLTLSDFSGTYATDEIVAYLRDPESKAAAQKTKKKALIGITGLKKMFLNIYNTVTGAGAKVFDDIGSAKEYLVS